MLDLAGETPLMIRRLIVPLTFAVVTIHAGQAFAQGAFPAPDDRFDVPNGGRVT